MTLLHSSDWHLGKSLFQKSLLADQEAALEDFRRLVETEKPHAVLLAGDLYDRSVPPEDAVKLLDRFLSEVVLTMKVPVIMIPGNHDSSTRVGMGAPLLRAAGLHVFSTPESVTEPVRIEAGGVKTAIYAIPYLEPSEWAFFLSKPLRTHADALSAILEHLKPQLENDRKEGRRTVLILHAYVTGGEPSESERPLSIGGSDLVPGELLLDFDYVALGHLHRPQKIQHEHIRYSGSLFPYSQSEASQNKGAVLVKLASSKEKDVIEFRRFETPRGLRVVRGAFQELLSGASSPQDDYVIAVLTDPSLPFEAFRQLNRVYPNLLHVTRDLGFSRSDAEAADTLARKMRREISDRDVLDLFLSATAATELQDEDRQWLFEQLDTFSKKEDEGATT